MKKLISIFMALALVLSGVCANAVQDDVTILNENKILTINEQFSEKTGLTVTIASSSTETIDSASLPLFMYLYSTDSKGLFKQDIELSSNWNSGSYTAYIDAPGDSRQIVFFYFNAESATTLSVLEQLNNCDSAEDMFELLSTDDNAALMGLDVSDEHYKTYAKYALDFCVENKDSDFTYDDFITVFEKGIDVAKILDSLKNAEVYGELEDIIKENAELFDIDFDGDYKSVKQKSKVYVEMYKNKSDIDDYASVAEIFEDAVKTVIKAQNKSSSSSGNSSSSSNKGGSTVVIPSTVPTTTEKPNEPVQPETPVIPDDTNKPSIEVIPQPLYSDIEGHFSKDAVIALSSKNIISGYPDGSFAPDNSVTRAEFAKMVTIASEIETKTTDSFEDVATNDWFAPYVGALSEIGVINGYDSKFNPSNSITRQDAACIIYRLLKNVMTFGESEAFADDSDISEYAKEAVNALRYAKVVNGSENKFSPRSYITRGEAAVMILNALNAIEK